VDVFGFVLGTFDMWLLGGAIFLMGWLLSEVATPAVKRHREAATEYRLAFEDVFLNLRENSDCPLAQIAQSFHAQHLSAITKFRPFIQVWSRNNFERSVIQYKEAHNNAIGQGSPFMLAASEKTDYARANRKHYRAAIDRLLSYA
jgi:hypothetical protein